MCTIDTIQRTGLIPGEGWWRIEYLHPGHLDSLYAKHDLGLSDTRPQQDPVPAICACGELYGASYYAWQRNRSETDDVPVMIEFQASEHLVAIDGRDFLYSIFELGDPARAQPLLERAYGTAVLRYAKKAWASEIQEFRIAMCDLAVHDLDVIKAHHANDIILAGRHRTMFRNAFVIRLPIIPSALIRVWSPENPIDLSSPQVSLRDLIAR